MRRSVLLSLALLGVAFGVAPALSASTWKLVLKDGKTIECDGAPLVVNDVYMFRSTAGEDGTVDADQVDREKTDRANKVTPPPRNWRMTGQSVYEPPGAAGASVLTLTDADFDAEVLHSKTPVLVDCWAVWCGFCRKIEPSVTSIAGEYAGRLKVGRLDVDRNPATAHRYRIHGLPTLLLFKQGRIVGTLEGAASKSEMMQMLESRL